MRHARTNRRPAFRKFRGIRVQQQGMATTITTMDSLGEAAPSQEAVA